MFIKLIFVSVSAIGAEKSLMSLDSSSGVLKSISGFNYLFANEPFSKNLQVSFWIESQIIEAKYEILPCLYGIIKTRFMKNQ